MVLNTGHLKSDKTKGLLLPTMKLSGGDQMAIDVMLLQKAMDDPNLAMILRFYKWNGFWLSIGKNQRNIPYHWFSLARKKIIKIVRRPTGGNAVLHGGGLTYSLVWISPPRNKLKAYYQASSFLIKGFSKLGLPLGFGNQPNNPSEQNCFASATAADLVDPYGNKRIGSAQLWRKGHLLQHGEIILDPPQKLWMEIFQTKSPEPASNLIPREGLDKIIYNSFETSLPQINWQIGKLTSKELSQIKSNSNLYLLRNSQSGLSITPAESIPSTA